MNYNIIENPFQVIILVHKFYTKLSKKWSGRKGLFAT